MKNSIQIIPIHRVKSFSEIQLEDDCRNTSFMTALHNFSGIDKILSNATPFDETSLVRVHKLRNKRLQSQGHSLGAILVIQFCSEIGL
jgi:hypothetical protein